MRMMPCQGLYEEQTTDRESPVSSTQEELGSLSVGPEVELAPLAFLFGFPHKMVWVFLYVHYLTLVLDGL